MKRVVVALAAGLLLRITEQSTYVFLDKSGPVVDKGYLDDLQLTTKVKSLVA